MLYQVNGRRFISNDLFEVVRLQKRFKTLEIDMKFRIEKESDHKAIEDVTYKAFENHPHHAPGAKPTEHKIIERLRENNALTLSLVAEKGDSIIGHIAFSPVLINGKDSKWYGLGPVSVLPEHQSEGIGSRLICLGLEQLIEQGAEGAVLLGEPEYYQRFGFKSDEKLILEGVPAEYFLSLPLKEIEMPQGEVNYHPAFFE
ncbi:GNAT family N-acetyltransferase [Aliivibrio fischeri]|nr:GNAT family N-acetyltransferase [Aliivibrio fischeri]